MSSYQSRQGDWSLAVLLPVHKGVDPNHLRASLASVQSQSLTPDEVVIVEDGPLTPAHDRAIEAFSAMPGYVRVRLPHPAGLSVALNAGLRHISSTWVARMDSDDIALPERLEAQREALRETEVDVVGTAMAEFERSPWDIRGYRNVPCSHAKIAKRMRMTNPVNHPTVVFRRQAVVEAGGYQPLAGLEDYDLWARLLCAGHAFRNLPEPLVLFRGGDSMLRRRRAHHVIRAEIGLQRNLVRYGLIGPVRAAFNCAMRTAFRIMPSSLMQRAYRAFLLSTRSEQTAPGRTVSKWP